MDVGRTKLLFQYALASAAQEDDFRNRELGPIHLLKYAYLGDLAYASRNEGTSFSGTRWIFHHFGPWSVEAWKEAPNAVLALGAKERHFSSRYQEDNIRWALETAKAPDDIVKGVPLSAAFAIKRAVHEFGTDTSALLHFVYKTKPMLSAAPGEVLDFRTTVTPEDEIGTEDLPALAHLSKTKIKKLRELVKERIATKKNKRFVAADPPPRYDHVFAQGQDWLDSLEGDPVGPLEGILEVGDLVWKSKARGEDDFT